MDHQGCFPDSRYFRAVHGYSAGWNKLDVFPKLQHNTRLQQVPMMQTRRLQRPVGFA